MDPRGWRVLTIDGGLGAVPLAILRDLKKMTGKEPWELFDVIVGTSTGGILAVLLGLLKMPVEDCDKVYQDLVSKGFAQGFSASGPWWRRSLGSISSWVPKFVDGYKYQAKPLEEAVKKELEKAFKNIDPSLMADAKLSTLPGGIDGRPYVVLVANKSGFVNPFLFTNFKRHSADYQLISCDVSIWEAVRASSAAPDLLLSIDIEIIPGRSFTFVSGLNYNNPIQVASDLVEGKEPYIRSSGCFNGSNVAVYVSLGTGMRQFNDPVCLATECETAHHNFYNNHRDYFRLNPHIGPGCKAMDLVKEATESYLVEPDVANNIRNLITYLM